MDSDDDFICDDGDMYDSGNEDCSEDDEEDSWIMDTEFEKEPSGSSNKSIEEKYQFEVGLNSTEIFIFINFLGFKYREYCQSHE